MRNAGAAGTPGSSLIQARLWSRIPGPGPRRRAPGPAEAIWRGRQSNPQQRRPFNSKVAFISSSAGAKLARHVPGGPLPEGHHLPHDDTEAPHVAGGAEVTKLKRLGGGPQRRAPATLRAGGPATQGQEGPELQPAFPTHRAPRDPTPPAMPAAAHLRENPQGDRRRGPCWHRQLEGGAGTGEKGDAGKGSLTMVV